MRAINLHLQPSWETDRSFKIHKSTRLFFKNQSVCFPFFLFRLVSILMWPIRLFRRWLKRIIVLSLLTLTAKLLSNWSSAIKKTHHVTGHDAQQQSSPALVFDSIVGSSSSAYANDIFSRLSLALQIPTISYQNRSLMNSTAFTHFHTHLRQSFPTVFSKLEVVNLHDYIGGRGWS